MRLLNLNSKFYIRFVIVLSITIVSSVFIYINRNNIVKNNLAKANNFSNVTEIYQQPSVTIQENSNKLNNSYIEQPLKETILDIELILQSKALTCELASLEMALSHYDIFVDELRLLDQVGFAEPQNSFMIGGKLYWADPDIGFVGDPDGQVWTKEKGLSGATGFGVNALPVLRVAKMYRPQSFQPSSPSLELLRSQLDIGRPVIFWHVPKINSYMGQTTYLTPSNKQVILAGEHANLMVGYYQSENGFRYIFLDPIFGRLDLDETQTQEIWDAYYRMSVVIA